MLEILVNLNQQLIKVMIVVMLDVVMIVVVVMIEIDAVVMIDQDQQEDLVDHHNNVHHSVNKIQELMRMSILFFIIISFIIKFLLFKDHHLGEETMLHQRGKFKQNFVSIYDEYKKRLFLVY